MSQHEKVRLHKLLAGWGLASRRTIEEWMLAGRVTVNGVPATAPGLVIVPADVQIKVDGKLVTAPDDTKAVPLVVALHKPAGVLTTLEDPHGRKTVAELLPAHTRLYPIGRLDLDSTGLLLATNDGELTNRLLHPRYKVEKEYRVRIAGDPLTDAECRTFAEGLELDDGPTAPCRIQRLSRQEYLVCLREGRKRQVKRMFQALDRKVLTLHRDRFGPIRLGSLKPGAWRPLTPEELRELHRLTDLSETAAGPKT